MWAVRATPSASQSASFTWCKNFQERQTLLHYPSSVKPHQGLFGNEWDQLHCQTWYNFKHGSIYFSELFHFNLELFPCIYRQRFPSISFYHIANFSVKVWSDDLCPKVDVPYINESWFVVWPSGSFCSLQVPQALLPNPARLILYLLITEHLIISFMCSVGDMGLICEMTVMLQFHNWDFLDWILSGLDGYELTINSLM